MNNKITETIESILKSPKCPVAILKQYASNGDSKQKRLVASNQNTPVETLVSLSYDEDFWTANYAIRNPNYPTDRLMKLLNDKPNLAASIADNPNCPHEILLTIAKGNDVDAKAAVLYRSNVPEEIVKLLMYDEDKKVQRALATCDNLPADVIKSLANSFDKDVRINIANRNDCPPEVLAKLAYDDSFMHDEYEIAVKALSNPNCPLETLKARAKDGHHYIQGGVAANPNCPLELIDDLAASSTDAVVSACRNSAIPLDKKYELLSKYSEEYDDGFGGTLTPFPTLYLLLIVYGNYKIENDFNKYSKAIDYAAVNYYISNYDEFMEIKKNDSFFRPFNERYGPAIKEMNDNILNDVYPNDLLYYISTQKGFEKCFSPEAVNKINMFRKSLTETDIEKMLLIIYNKTKVLFEMENEETTSLENQVKNVSSHQMGIMYASDEVVSDFTRLFSKKLGNNIIIKLNDYEYAKRNAKKAKVYGEEIEYIISGEYPEDKVSELEYPLLEFLFDNGLLYKSDREFDLRNPLGGRLKYPEYKVNGKGYIRINENTWFEVKPIKWILDDKNKCLKSEKTLIGGPVGRKALNDYFYSDVFIEGIDYLDKKEQGILNDLESEKNFDKLKEEELKEIQRQEELEALDKELFEALAKIDKIRTRQAELIPHSENMTKRRITLGYEDLLVKVDDHFEIKKERLEFLKLINFIGIPMNDVKLSGIDFTGTNIYLDPQSVYQKDLSNCIFDSETMVLKSLSGCNLCGSDLSKVFGCYGIKEAIIDDKTILSSELLNELNNGKTL